MEMFLMAICLSMFGLAVAVAAFGAATRPEQPAPEIQPEAVKMPNVDRPRFFAENLVLPSAAQPRVPIEALLLQIDSHVRLEHAAAESFLEYPTAALLHSRTISPLIQ